MSFLLAAQLFFAATNLSAQDAPVRSAPKTVDELRARIQEITARPELAPAQVAVKVASLDTGRVLYEENALKLLHPASVMKIYTLAAALDRLTPDYRFKTSIYASAKPNAAGVITGDLIIYGRGDPSIAARFNNGDYNKAIDELAARIAAAGVKRVEGDLVGDESYFTGAPHGFGWEWADLQWHDGAEVSALSVNDNSLDLFVKPGATPGSPCSITTGPPTPLVTFTNRTTTTARGSKRELSVYRALDSNVVEVGGSLPAGDPGWSGSITAPHPAMLFVYMLRASLAQRGVTVTGRSRTVDARERAGVPLQTNSLTEIASLLSPPLSEIAAQTLKPSQNLYAELILRTLGNNVRTDAKLTSEEAGLEAVRAFLREAGADTGLLVLTDGSGLSRRDLVTAETTLKLLAQMDRHRYAKVFRDALPIAGVDGSLRNRMKNSLAANNVRAKTGTLPTVATLSGYVTSAAGERLVFSILINNYPDTSASRRSFIDDIAVLLASFNGKSAEQSMK
ncbi:MAG: D-alanyl-D-alanine carboxypeptidase/D-alanyl-D-alanine-endopeptidase [Acidobacteria bacterium]|nr:D-alanyl-D-alanine carboxypeptidase/D-alanyl-D-alanine-endopeptidase [Acidobacteriota bacterium]